jgi:hypothetical protein
MQNHAFLTKVLVFPNPVVACDIVTLDYGTHIHKLDTTAKLTNVVLVFSA